MATRTSGGRLGAVALPRMDLRLLAGLLLVAVAVAGGLAFWNAARVTEPVVVAARDIPAGHVIERSDLALAEARLEGPLASLAFGEADLSTIVGGTAAGAIHDGELVVRPDLGTGPLIGADDVAVTVPVAADTVYPELRPGDVVAVLATSERGKPQSRTVTLLERATVFSVVIEASRVSLGNDGDEAGRPANVTLVVPRSEAERVAHALVNETLTLVLLPPAAPEGSP